MPVVITKNISDDSDIILTHNAGAVLESLDTPGYQKAIDKIDILLSEPQDQQGARIIKLAQQFRNFSIAEKIYSGIYKN